MPAGLAAAARRARKPEAGASAAPYCCHAALETGAPDAEMAGLGSAAPDAEMAGTGFAAPGAEIAGPSPAP